jgi:tetratricopeptide (TPR) repeat protein
MGRRQRRAERAGSQQHSEPSERGWVYGRRAAIAAFVLLVLDVMANLSQLSLKRIIVTVIAATVVIISVAVRSLPWNWPWRAHSFRTYLAIISVFVVLGLVGSLIRIYIVEKDADGQKATTPTTVASNKEALVLVAEFDAPDPKSARDYRVTESVKQKLEAAFAQYHDVRVAPLGRTITAQDGSQVARTKGRERHAAIVIWGWYGKSSTTAALSVHFELLANLPKYATPKLASDTRGQLRREPLNRLESFDIQETLSSELLQLTEISVGLIRLVANDADGAISHFTGALKVTRQRSSAEAQVRFHRGIAYMFKAGDTQSYHSSRLSLSRALADFTAVILQRPTFIGAAYSNRGDTYRLLGKFNSAVADYTAAIRLLPDYGNYLGRGSSYAGIPNFPRALADLTHAIKLQSTVTSYEERGKVHAAKKDTQKALKDFTSAIRLGPRANSYTLRAEVLDSVGRRSEALDDLNNAIRLEPKNPTWHRNRGIHYFRQRDWDAALADLSKAIELASNDYDRGSSYLERGTVYRLKGDFDRAISDYNWVIERLPQLDIPNLKAKVYYNRGLAFEEKGEPTQAIADYTTTIATNEDSRNAYLHRGILYFLQDDYEKSVQDLTKVLKLDPDNPQALLTRSQAYRSVYDYSHALADVNAGIRTSNDPIFYLGRAEIMTIRGNREQAISDLRYVVTHSQDPGLRTTAESQLSQLLRSNSP